MTEAEEACRRALALDANFFWAASPLAKILALQYRFDDALAVARDGTLAAVAENQKDKYGDEIWRTLGTIQLHLGHAEALESLQTARTIDPADWRNWLMLARLHVTLPGHTDITTAMEEAKNAHTFTGRSDPMFNRILAQAYLVNAEFGEAARHALAAIEGGDRAAYGHLIIAIAKAQMGLQGEARIQLAKAIENWPEFHAGDVIVQAERGFLWFDTAAELEALREEAERLVETGPASPG